MKHDDITHRLNARADVLDYRSGALMIEAKEEIKRLRLIGDSYSDAVVKLVSDFTGLLIDAGSINGCSVMVNPHDVTKILKKYEDRVFGKEAA